MVKPKEYREGGGGGHLERSMGMEISSGVPMKLCLGPMVKLASCPLAFTEKILRSRVSKVFQKSRERVVKEEGKRNLHKQTHTHTTALLRRCNTSRVSNHVVAFVISAL